METREDENFGRLNIKAHSGKPEDLLKKVC